MKSTSGMLPTSLDPADLAGQVQDLFLARLAGGDWHDLSRVAVQWLEPAGPDSAMQWGLFDPIFELLLGEFGVVPLVAAEAGTLQSEHRTAHPVVGHG